MASLVDFVRRVWTLNNPPEVVKSPDAIRIGLLGASWIAPNAVILPAKSHPDIIVASVAARDEKLAQAYAKKHGIPHVHKSYEDLLIDPTITAVYIPLPNGLHYEYALRALQQNKHVLLEKPSVSNTTEATRLWSYHASLPVATRPVLLEAVHYLFHPAWQTFLTHLSPQHIESADAHMSVFAGFLKADDIRFRYELAGGALMDMGTYAISALRQVFGTEPTECISATPRLAPSDAKCDAAMDASYRFPNDGVGRMAVDLATPGRFYLPAFLFFTPRAIKITVVHSAIPVPDSSHVAANSNTMHTRSRTATLYNFVGPHYWHTIELVDTHTLKSTDSGKVIETWTETSTKKAYVWDDSTKNADTVHNGAEYWSSYRHMMEQFVNKIKKRAGSGVWADGEYSIAQMRVIDQGYEKAGLPLRPTSEFELS